MSPKLDHLNILGNGSGIRLGDTLEDFGHITQVVCVVGLGRRGSEPLNDLLIGLDRCCHDTILLALDTSAVLELSLRHEHPIHDTTKDGLERCIRVWLNINHIEMAHVTVSDRLLTTRRLHSGTESNADSLAELLLAVELIPALVVHPLAKKLDGRLGSILLLLRHVKIINEDDGTLSSLGSVDTLTPSVHVAINDVLGLIGRCLGREGETEEGPVFVLELGVELLHHGD